MKQCKVFKSFVCVGGGGGGGVKCSLKSYFIINLLMLHTIVKQNYLNSGLA